MDKAVQLDLTGIALVITAVGSAAAAIISAINGRKITSIANRVEEVHVATNSMKDQLVNAARSEGRSEGRTEGHAEGVRQERDNAAARKDSTP